jgi:hypothetical protein
MAEGPSEAIEFPDHQDITLAEMRQRLLQDGPLGAGPTDDLLRDLPTAGLAEGVQLQGEMLVARADPGIANVHGTPQQFEILVGFSACKHNQFFEHKDAAQPPKNQEGLIMQKIVRQNGRFIERWMRCSHRLKSRSVTPSGVAWGSRGWGVGG